MVSGYSVTVLKARIPLDADVLDKDRLTVDGMSGEVESVVTPGTTWLRARFTTDGTTNDVP